MNRFVFIGAFALLPFCVQGQVLTQHNDNTRSGANLNEIILNTSNVNVNQFGKLFSRSVDAEIYAQPLWVPNLSIGGITRNVVYVATEGNTVYAFDADSPTASAPLWQVNLGTPVSDTSVSCTTDLIPQIGITSTPVIDLARDTIYVDAKTVDSEGAYHHRLHALDLKTGAEKYNGPVEISATMPGTGEGGTSITFNPLHENQRLGLLLANNKVYVGFGSHCDANTYHGWIFAFGLDSTRTTLEQKAVFIDTANGSEGGIWQAGQGPAADSQGRIYFLTGNGTFDYSSGGHDLGDSAIKLGPSLSVLDYFTPYNQLELSDNDLDLGSSGLLLLPSFVGSGNLMIGGGKQGVLYLLDTANLGKYNTTSNNVVQEWQATAKTIHGSPVFWNGPNGMWLYIWGDSDTLKQYAWSTANNLFVTTPTYVGAESTPFPGGILALSANGSTPGTGILWATSSTANANHATVPGMLHAYDASNVTNELWNSYQSQSRDDFGNLAKFCPPTIANGKVYMATFSNQLVVYGLLTSPTAPSNLSAKATASSVTLTWSASTDSVAVQGYYVRRISSNQTTILGPTTSTTYTDTGLQSSTKYSYNVQAYDVDGNYSSPSTTINIRTKR